MSAKRRTSTYEYTVPDTLDGHPFYGLDCDDPEQQYYRDCMWDKNTRLVIVDAVAGSGKTTLAVAVGNLFLKHGLMDEVLYIRTPSSEGRIGFLPGDQATKERPYMQPLYTALVNIGENPCTCINDSGVPGGSAGTGAFTAMTDVYILGSDYKRKFIIIDEAQCMTVSQLKAILTRCHDDCKVVVIGSTLQVQGIMQEESGLTRCIEHFRDKTWAKVCHLTKNYRGELSAWADRM